MQTVIGLSLFTLALFALAVAYGAFVIVCERRAGRTPSNLWAMINQTFAGTDTSRRNPATCYSGVTAGQPYLVGSLAAVALDTAADVASGTPTFLFGGTFALTVTAKSSLSPSTGHTINPGDPIYADGGTLDAASNITYGFTLDANSGGTLFGYLDPTGPALASGTTASVNVLLTRGM